MNILSQFQLEPCYDHWIAANNILRYLRGMINHCLKYNSKEVKLTGFTDSEWGGSETDGRSTTRGYFSLGSAMISWMSRKQDPVALSSVEEEYMTACEVGKDIVCLRKFMTDLFKKPLGHIMINCDNQSCIKLYGDSVFHARTNHINNKLHYIRNLVQDGIMKIQYVPTNDQVFDILKRPLPNKKFEYLRMMLHLVDISDFIDDDKSFEEIFLDLVCETHYLGVHLADTMC